MLDRIRAVLGHLLLVVLLLWPLCHLGLVHFANLSSWKLAGWGMYATIHPNLLGIHALVLPPEAPLDDVAMPFAVAVRHVAVQGADGVRHLPPGDLENDPSGDVRFWFDDIRVLRSREAMHRSAQVLRELSPAPDPDVLFLVVTPRLDVFGEVTYTETTAYLLREGDVEPLGTFSSRGASGEEILGRIEERRATVETS